MTILSVDRDREDPMAQSPCHHGEPQCQGGKWQHVIWMCHGKE